MTSQLRITIELVPQTSWYNNLRSLMPKSDWKILRNKILLEHNYMCAICSSKDKLECHEFWTYDDTLHVQTLKAVLPLCKLCHAVKHIGRTKNDSKELYEAAVAHFMKLNNCTRMDFEIHRLRALDQFEERSKHEWRLDIGNTKGVNHML